MHPEGLLLPAVVVMFSALAPIIMNPFQGIRAAKKKQNSPDKGGQHS